MTRSRPRTCNVERWCTCASPPTGRFGRADAIFSLEVSRLARSSADWHRLLELCGLTDVLLADEQAVYTPRDHNDRLLLGLKGTMSEADPALEAQPWER